MVVVAAIIIAFAICFVGNVIREACEELTNGLICSVAIERMRLKIDLDEAGYKVPDWLDDEVEDAESSPKGRLLTLVKKDPEDSA
jgi:hypothetical protein